MQPLTFTTTDHCVNTLIIGPEVCLQYLVGAFFLKLILRLLSL